MLSGPRFMSAVTFHLPVTERLPDVIDSGCFADLECYLSSNASLQGHFHELSNRTSVEISCWL